MAFDKKAYRQGVVKELARDKARLDAVKESIRDLQTGSSSPDSLSRVDLPGLFAVEDGWDAAALQTHFAEFAPALNALATNDLVKTVKQLYDKLGAQVLDPGFWKALDAGKSAAEERQLEGFAAAIRADFPLGVVTTDQVGDIARSMGLASVPIARLVDTLTRAGITACKSFEAPTIVVPAAVTKALAMPEFRTLAHVLSLGDPRSNVSNATVIDRFARHESGPAWARADIDAASHACNQGSSDAALAAQKALTVIKDGFASEADLHTLALASALARAKTLLESGRPRLDVRQTLVSDGWSVTDASRLVTSLQTSTGGSGAPTLDAVAQLFGQGQLSEATRLIAAVPLTDDNSVEHASLNKRLAEAHTKKAALLDEFRRATERGDFLAAGQAARAALVIDANDQELPEQLLRLPPPRPAQLSVTASGAAAKLTWAAGVDSGTSYVVVRSASGVPRHATDGDVLASGLRESSYTDPNAPIGRTVHYSVLATNDGTRFSDPVSTEFVLIPGLAAFDVSVDASTAHLNWVAPAGAHSVYLTVDRPDGTRQSHDLAPAGRLTIPGLTMGARYDLTAVVRYRSNGVTLESNLTEQVLVPRGQIAPVTDLRARPDLETATDRLILEWTIIEGYDVELWSFPITTGLGVGATIDLHRLSSGAGTHLAVRPAGVAGTTYRAEATLPDRVQRIVAVTVNEGGGVLGNSIVAGSAPAPGPVRALNLGDDLRLSWTWQDEDYDYLVEWTSDLGLRRDLVTQSRYATAGGFTVAGGRTAKDLRVSTVVRQGLDEWVSRPRPVEMAPAAVHVTYDVVLSKGRFGGASTAALTANSTDHSGPLELLGVIKAGSIMPSHHEDGTSLGAVTLNFSGGTASATVQLGRSKGPFWIRFFPASTGSVVLFDPPTTHLKGS